MKVESKNVPSAVTVEENGDVILTENAEMLDKDGEEFYQYDSYRINVRPRAGLKESIETNFADWLEFAKKETSKPSDQEIAEANETLKVVDILMEVGLL